MTLFVTWGKVKKKKKTMKRSVEVLDRLRAECVNVEKGSLEVREVKNMGRVAAT
jgi:hypothetical protein